MDWRFDSAPVVIFRRWYIVTKLQDVATLHSCAPAKITISFDRGDVPWPGDCLSECVVEGCFFCLLIVVEASCFPSGLCL